jgi:hypothetical protein
VNTPGTKAYSPVKIPRKIYDSFDSATQVFIQRRIEKGEAILEGP